ncbi:hypothetical protein [uncultured Clostridium sp.]|uniref:hypothetical protein n=1 Tax=uncultured Clostridium sp. TaxID=59620 RepID=UPI00262D39FF|nr:hypothetical protein [uncultured Clostridium sp.]
MKCRWCGKTLSEEEIALELRFGGKFDNFKCCCPECLEKLSVFDKEFKKNGICIGILSLIGFVGMIALNIIYMANGIKSFPYGSFAWFGLIVGGTLLKFRISSTKSNDKVSIKGGILLGKIIGIIFFVIGLIFGILTIIQFV